MFSLNATLNPQATQMNVQNTIQNSTTLLIVMSQTNTKLNLENLIRIRMNEIETQIKGNLSEFELGAIRQVENVKLLEGQSMVTL